jgi:hypothetical protein
MEVCCSACVRKPPHRASALANALGILLAFLFTRLSVLVEVGRVPVGSVWATGIGNVFGITRSRNVVLKLSSLFALNSFAGGFIVQSFAAYWFYMRFGVRLATLRAIFFWAHLFAGISALVAPCSAHCSRPNDGLHAPAFQCSSHSWAVDAQALSGGVRSLCISQMDVPARQSYTMAVVPAGERSTAGGFTGVARTPGAAISPLFAGFLSLVRSRTNFRLRPSSSQTFR